MSLALFKYVRKNMLFFGCFMVALFIGVLYKEHITPPDLTCIVSKVDGNTYCVRARKKKRAAADLLARATTNCKVLINYLKKKYPDDPKVLRLINNFNPNSVCEIQPTSPDVAYNENKGDILAFCLNEKKGGTKLIDLHTLVFVTLHELAHTMTVSDGHKQEFWDNFRFLLKHAKNIGIHHPVDYGISPTEFCGMELNDNPYYDK